jgi:beta-mannosidase
MAIKQSGNRFRVRLTAEKPALWTWLNLKDVKASYSDNFIHVRPGVTAEIWVQPEHSMTTAEFSRAIQARSLRDTYVPRLNPKP